MISLKNRHVKQTKIFFIIHFAITLIDFIKLDSFCVCVCVCVCVCFFF